MTTYPPTAASARVTSPESRWLGGVPPGTDAPVRLFCFPHAGGGSGAFRGWHQALAPLAEVRPVVLPGRERRLKEVPYVAMEQLVAPLYEALVPFLDRPFAFFGHSMGAAVAYEVARRCTAEGRPPVQLFVSGRRAPHLPARRRSYAELPDEAFLEQVGAMNGTPADVVGQPELFRLFLPCLRADFELNDTYRPLPGVRLACPVTALAGREDPEANTRELTAWSQVTSGASEVSTLPGDHFYLKDAPSALLDLVRTRIERARA
ncbi:thioesterase II family protein [Streptomyces sp. NBC_00209]|uniref:thioesterase II family protein n=1 Tax=Streptomyces sp. NBC_00209 TaxID=2975682 RepID=UPI00325421BA